MHFFFLIFKFSQNGINHLYVRYRMFLWPVLHSCQQAVKILTTGQVLHSSKVARCITAPARYSQWHSCTRSFLFKCLASVICHAGSTTYSSVEAINFIPLKPSLLTNVNPHCSHQAEMAGEQMRDAAWHSAKQRRLSMLTSTGYSVEKWEDCTYPRSSRM